jgi:aminocarboxymuconate-semialdehyde decarboxylase
MTSFTAIDAHGHFVPAGLIAAAEAAASLPSINAVTLESGVKALAMPGLDVVRPMPGPLTSVTASHEWLESRHIGRQVVGTWADLLGYELPAAEGAYWCQLVNDLQLTELEGQDRLIPMAILPLQDPAASVAEIARAYDAGYRTVTIGCSAGARQLDDPELEQVWAELAQRGVGVVMHPMYHASEPHLSDLGLPNTVGRPHDTDIAVARLVLSGTLARHGGSKLLLMHGGGSIPLLWGRLERNHALTPGTYDPEASRSALWVDTVVYRPESLEFLVAQMGADRVMLGSDYPFPIQDPQPREVVAAASLDDAVRTKILQTNAEVFFGL